MVFVGLEKRGEGQSRAGKGAGYRGKAGLGLIFDKFVYGPQSKV